MGGKVKPPIFRAATLKKHGSGSCIIRKYGIAGFHGEFYYAEKAYNKLASWGYVIFWVSVFILMRTCSVTVLCWEECLYRKCRRK